MDNFFKRRRLELGKTQRQIADALHMTASAVALWEAGVSTPRGKIFDRVAAAYHTTPETIAVECLRIQQAKASAAVA